MFGEVRRGTQGAIPIVMLTSGGYQKCTADIVASSIVELNVKNLIDGPKIEAPTRKKVIQVIF